MVRKRKKESVTGTCMECRRAYLMDRGDGNPVLARCMLRGVKYAARVHRCRDGFEPAEGEPVIHREG